MSRFKVYAYVCDDPDAPRHLRAVAHWVDAAGVAQVAIAWGETREAAATKLQGFLAERFAKAESRRAGAAKGRAAIAAKRAS